MKWKPISTYKPGNEFIEDRILVKDDEGVVHVAWWAVRGDPGFRWHTDNKAMNEQHIEWWQELPD